VCESARLVEPIAAVLVERLRLHERDARATVEHLIRSEQAGKSSHGLIRVAYAITSGKFGPFHGRPAPTPAPGQVGRLHVDGAGHFGYAVLHNLVEAGCDEARRSGVCVATSAHVYPSGSLGDWAREAGQRGVGVFLVSSSPRRVAPPGGTRPVVGTNAVCIGLPTTPLTFVSDSATSEITHGALLLARESGEPLPPHSAVDAEGRPTIRPEAVDPTKGQGALLPFGGSHKAFALAMGVELLACLGGGAPGAVESREHGVFGLFLGPAVLAARMDDLSGWLEGLDRAGTRIPGWTSGRRARAEQEAGVVTIPGGTLAALSKVLGEDVLRSAAVDTGGTR
jgi:LDH2 family malate/lactate/ureidoglycolate dehydrogenase